MIKKQPNNYPTTGGEQVAWNVGGGNVQQFFGPNMLEMIHTGTGGHRRMQIESFDAA